MLTVKTLLTLLVSLLILSSCKTTEPKLDPCVFLGDIGHCFPINQEKEEYERPIEIGDYFITPEEYGEIVKHHNRLHKELDR